MPVIPTFTVSPDEVGRFPSRPRPVQADVGAFTGAARGAVQAGAEVSQAAGQFAEKYVQARMAVNAAEDVHDLSNQLEQVRFQASQIPNRDQATAVFDAGAAKILDAYKERGGNPLVTAHAITMFDRESAIQRANTQRVSFALESSKVRGDLDVRTQDNINKASSATDPITRAHYMDTLVADVRGVAAGGYMMPEEAEKHILQAKAELDETSVLKAINSGDLGRAQKMVQDTTGFPNLDAIRRERLESTIHSKMVAQAAQANAALNRQTVLEEKMHKKIADDTMKDLHDKIEAGTATQRDLDAARPNLPWNDWKAITAQFKGGTEVNDNHVVQHISENLGKMDVSTFINDAQAANKMTARTADEYRAINRVYLEHKAPNDPLQEALKFHDTAMDPKTIGISNPAMAAAAATVAANTRVDFLSKYMALSDEDKNDRAKVMDIMRDIYRKDNLSFVSSMRQSANMPTFSDKGRNDIQDGDIDAASTKAQQQFDARKLTQEQFNVEMDKIRRWREILNYEKNLKLHMQNEQLQKNPDKAAP